jgi:DNA-binding CsgD family transcriptional regulator
MTRSSLTGREGELQRIRALIQGAGEGRGGAFWLTGEPGIGKSALLDAAERRCREAGYRVLRGAAEEMEAGLPFAAIGSWCRAATPDNGARRIAAALRGDAAAQAATAAHRELVITEVLLNEVEQWCAEGPTVLLLDDAQWADRPSLLTLHRLGLMAGHLPLVLGLAARPVPRNEDLARLLRSLEARGGVALRLAPLTAAEVAVLVERQIGARPDRALARLLAGAAGNPLYVSELVAALTREGRVRTAGGVARIDARAPDEQAEPGRLPNTLSDAILRRLAFLSEPARSVLRVAAVLGAGLNLAELAAILERSPVELYELIAEAVQAGVLADSGGELTFRHDLIRQALSESQPEAAHMGLWTQAAHALADAGAPVERVVRYLQCPSALDARMLEWLAVSADALVVRTPHMAVDLLRRALERLEPGDPRAAVLRTQLVRALLWSGAADQAEQAARAALVADHDLDAEVRLRSLLIHACFQQGRIGRAVAECESAMQVPGLSEAQAARFEFFAAQCRFTRGDLDPAEEPAALRMTAAADAEVRAYGLSYLACLRYQRGQFAESLELTDRARAAIADREAMPEWRSGVGLNRAFCLAELDRLQDAAEAFETGTREAERHGSAYWPWYQLGTARVHFLAGRWDDALAEIKAALDTVDGLDEVGGLDGAWGLRGQAALIAAHRGDAETTAALLDELGPMHDRAFYSYVGLWSLALAHEAEDRPDEAFRVLDDAWTKAGWRRRRLGLHFICPDLARLASTLQDKRRQARIADDAAELAEIGPAPSIHATAALCRALATDDADLMHTAERAFAKAGRPLYQAYAAENAALLRAREHRTQEARAALATAADLYDGLDARWDLARAEQRLKAYGVRRAQSTRRRPRNGWESLTETELRIAALVAEGNSNPAIAAKLYISRRTVQTHVSNILAKLDLTSRVELAVLVHQRSGQGQGQGHGQGHGHG